MYSINSSGNVEGLQPDCVGLSMGGLISTLSTRLTHINYSCIVCVISPRLHKFFQNALYNDWILTHDYGCFKGAVCLGR